MRIGVGKQNQMLLSLGLLLLCYRTDERGTAYVPCKEYGIVASIPILREFASNEIKSFLSKVRSCFIPYRYTYIGLKHSEPDTRYLKPFQIAYRNK